ncbi:succinate dehydrogenase, cytochrome b556 subunit [Croceibacterium sp. LX-88]|jgi:succinate dehydrogenase / fumarate reductase cytochrome b subunit|uniref:Succinate dehydrogenase cytochrome b556 subunit n=1 Tax=Croceibacterium selenioxidans TaxID=2838833 RepID=A0ABS5W1L3_9SPHN|nr:succinate dehydrogenase, cytochrome b556 subunit [Croceibacterium selenioxidans]MBT2133534.1 succinate dehydrogenase, cytochrome b556 subunit [Croceibacterium selenioxidans]
MAQRPLSPHLSIWKWGPAMLVSILHRATGDAMALVGLPILLWWLAALASGPEAYAFFANLANSWVGYIVLVGISWSFFNHFASGIRHFVMDIGAGYAVDSNNRWSVLTTVSGFVLTAAFWAVIVLR